MQVQRALLEAEQPDLVVFSGDMVSGWACRRDPDCERDGWFEARWRQLTAPVHAAGLPYAVTLGWARGSKECRTVTVCRGQRLQGRLSIRSGCRSPFFGRPPRIPHALLARRRNHDAEGDLDRRQIADLDIRIGGLFSLTRQGPPQVQRRGLVGSGHCRHLTLLSNVAAAHTAACPLCPPHEPLTCTPFPALPLPAGHGRH